ncbi:MAG: TRAP transporter fused permease subunit [Rhodospirillales bacterium]|nr:TRAP transporter fused permease subunit [Rhodospirillales bacterium]
MTSPPPQPPSVGTVDSDALEFQGLRRTLGPFERTLFYWVGAAFTAFHLFILNVHPIDSILFRSIHLAWGSVLGFALFAVAAGRSVHKIPIYDWALMAAAIACAIYIGINIDELQFRAGALYEPGDVIAGVVGTILVLEFSRRTAGLALTIVAFVFLLYAVVGPWLPGVLYHKGYNLAFIFTYIFSDQGVFGPTLEVSSTFIVMFTAFAAFLTMSKAGDYFNDLSMSLIGWARGGPAKGAVLSGIMFGSISGSSVANVVASGSVTIPMMRRVGYDRPTAAAIEATSSTGGQITPPVMGAGAFIMAEVTGIPYGDIAFAAIIPCLLFYIACYAHCDLHAVRSGLRGYPRSELPALRPMLFKLYLLLPIVVLVWAFVEGYSGFRAAGLGIVACIAVSWLAREHRMGPRRVIDALDMAARDCIQLVAVCAAAGIIVGVIALTGIGGRFSSLVLAIAGNSQILAMLFTMVIVTILGMGMPTTAAYAIAAAVVAPGLIRMGIAPLVAHMFIFYFAVLSAITPPVAVASFAAAAMAQADPWKTSWIAVKLGLATFIVPFMFFASPLLLGQGPLLDVLVVFVTASIGVVLLAASTEGWLHGPLAMPPRAILFVAAILLVAPEPITDGIGLALAIAVWLWQRRQHGSDPASKVPARQAAASLSSS